jgi:ubiquitin carboxyl-terminal hydrolase 10
MLTEVFFQLPWLSNPESAFPPPAARRRRKRRDIPDANEPLSLPSRTDEETAPAPSQAVSGSTAQPAPSASDVETPQTSQAPSEVDSTHPTTPASTTPQASVSSASRTQSTHTRTTTRPAVPLIPIAPAKPKTAPQTEKPATGDASEAEKTPDSKQAETTDDVATPPASESAASAVQSPPPKATPKSWADLVRRPTNSAAPPVASTLAGPINGTSAAQANSLADVLESFNVDSDSKIAFLEPRGLVNTGNMCYMNSVRGSAPLWF